MYELKDKKGTVLKTKVNIKRLKVYKCSSEQNGLHAMMNKKADAKSDTMMKLKQILEMK